MKIEKATLIGHAIELTKLARGPVPQMPPVTVATDGTVTLSVAQELENRVIFRIFTEFYCGLDAAMNDETVFHDPLDEATIAAAAAGSPATVAATIAAAVPIVASAVGSAVPTAAPIAATVATAATALSSLLAKPLGS
jgi:hypothetical protein